MQCAAGPAQLGRAAFNTPAFRQTPGRPASAAVLGLGSRSLHSVSGTSRPLSQLPGLTQWSGLRRQVLPKAAAQPGGSAGSNSEQDKQRQAANNSSSSSQGSRDNPALEFPLLLASSLSHVNRQYIKMRRRRKWWNKLGGYPKVPSENMDHLPEPAVELWQKVLPLGMIFFCASFNLTILQSLKDSIMVTAGGAEVLPFLASCCVLPASVAFFVLYGKLVAHLPEKAVFYAAVTPLLGYYALFAAAIYPIAGSLHPLELMAKIAPSVPVGLHGLLKVVGNWTYSLFFCMAELWGAVVISVLFWSLANEVCTVDEAKAVYPFMAIGANIALVAAGCYIRLVNHTLSTTLAGDTQLLSLRVLIGTVMAMTGAMFAAKAFIDAKVLQPALKSADGAAAAAAAGGGAAKPAGKKKKSKGSFGEGIAVLKKSPKIRNLALLVMSYGVGHRLFEFAWKGQLRLLYPTVQGYQSVLADVATYTGMLTLASMVVSRLVFQHAGWGVAASVTPAVMGVAGTMFFAGTLLAGLPSLSPEMAATIAGIGATAGVVTQVFARASKYSLFDPAKEMVYIEMDADEKKQGKAAVDLVGSQIGKSGASWITQAFLLGCGSIAAAMPFTGVIFAGVIITWIKATLGLHSQMQEVEKARLAQQQQQQAAAAAALGAGGAAAAALQQSGKAGSASSVNGGSGAQFNMNGHGVNGSDDGQQLNGAAKELSKVKLQ
ncbi:hypothetical protein OEZ85_001890 [Tetradesmus obliquus]|uniref:ADP,ATP carrier protein n=1 Tax=Tetradesmus obliquus TaxID=3088 RepID=A0ABY8U5E8_TETOB|nr:hypothetical protein OEZ85_001890 [Tetradesmus obliquus]